MPDYYAIDHPEPLSGPGLTDPRPAAGNAKGTPYWLVLATGSAGLMLGFLGMAFLQLPFAWALAFAWGIREPAEFLHRRRHPARYPVVARRSLARTFLDRWFQWFFTVVSTVGLLTFLAGGTPVICTAVSAGVAAACSAGITFALRR